MGLQIWLPLNGSIYNQGLDEDAITNSSGITYASIGKIGSQSLLSGSMTTSKNYLGYEGTICFWIYITENSNRGMLYGNSDTGASLYNRKWSLFLYPTRNDLHCWGCQKDSKNNSPNGNWQLNGVIPDNKWTHICITHNRSMQYIYINGIQVAHKEWDSSGDITFDVSTPLMKNDVGRYLQDYRIYDNCLSPKQVKEISKGLVCHYPLGEVDGKIGGRNLLRQSSLIEKQLMCNSITTMNSVTLRQYEEEGYHLITPSEGNQNNGIGFQYNDFTSLNIKQGDTITFSCDIKGTSDLHKPNIIIRFQANSSSGVWWGNNAASSNPVYFTPSNDNWQRISATYTIPSDEWTGKIVWLTIHGNFESDLYIKNLKLEKSSTATPWTPAPEDDASFYDNVVYDTSGYNNNGSVTDSTCPTWSSDTPRYKGSYMFNGNNQYLKFQSPISSAFAEFSISCWVKFNNVTNETNDAICTMRSGVGTGVALFRIRNNFRFDDNAFTTFSEYVIPQNTWLHIVVTRSLSCKKLYINGILKQTTNTVGDMKLISNVGTIGASSQKGDNLSNYLNGRLSDFRIYATALDNQTIEELYKVGASVDSSGNLMLAGEVIEE